MNPHYTPTAHNPNPAHYTPHSTQQQQYFIEIVLRSPVSIYFFLSQQRIEGYRVGFQSAHVEQDHSASGIKGWHGDDCHSTTSEEYEGSG